MIWYKAKCITECIFGRVRRKAGDIYEGNVKPPHHFEILSEIEVEDDAAPVFKQSCPHCGNDISGEPAPALPKASEAIEHMADAIEAADSEEEEEEGNSDISDAYNMPQLLTHTKLDTMNKADIERYGRGHGVTLDPDVMTKAEMILRVPKLA